MSARTQGMESSSQLKKALDMLVVRLNSSGWLEGKPEVKEIVEVAY